MPATGDRIMDEQEGSGTRGPAARPRPAKRGNAARLFGYAVFISFALGPPPRGTQSYASDLARRLRERDFTVFFSEDEAPPGEQLDRSLRAALHRSKTLVVIANRATLATPRWVRKEVEEFRRRHPNRPVVSISVGGAVEDSELAPTVREWLSVDDKIWLDESDEAVARGIASEALVERLATAPRRFKSNVSWRWVVRGVVSTLALLAVALGVAAKLATDSAERARAELRRAVSLRLAAEAPTILSGARREGDERGLLQLVAAARLGTGPALDSSLLDAILRRRHLIKLIASDAPVNSVAFSPDGTRIASRDRGYYFPGVPIGRGNNVHLWDATSGYAVGEPFSGHTNAIVAVAFSRDGARLVSASHDETIRQWNVTTGQPIGTPLEAHAGSVNAMAISPDGSHIASGHSDETLRLWNAGTGEPIGVPLEGHKLAVNAVAFSPDGTRIVSGSWGPSLRLWDARTAESIGVGEGGAVLSLAFSPDGARIVSGGHLPGAATGVKDDDVRMWDGHNGAPIGDPRPGHQRMVNTVAWSPDGTLIASGSVDTTVRVWDAQSAQAIGAPLEGHFEPVNSVAFDPAGRRIVSGGDDSTIRVWSIRNDMTFGAQLGHQTSPGAVVFSRDGSRIISGHQDGRLRFWDSRTRALLGSTPEQDSGDVLSLAISPNGERIVSGHSDGLLRIWGIRSAELIGKPLEGHLGQIRSVAWSPDGTRIASGGSAIVQRKSVDHVIRLWDAETGGLIAALEGHKGPISDLAFIPDGSRLVSSSGDGTLRQWDASSGRLLGTPFEDAGGPIAVSPDGARIVSARYAVIHIRDSRTGKPVEAPLEGHSQGVTSVAISPDGSRIVSGGMDGVVRVWDTETGSAVGAPLEAHTTSVTSIAYSPDGTQLVSSSNDETLRVWPAPKVWADVLCEKLTRNMSRAEWRLWVSSEIDYTVQCPMLPIPPDAVITSTR